VAQEQAVYDAIARSDTGAFNKAVGRDFVYVSQQGAVQWALTNTSSILGCALGSGWTLDNPKTTEVGSDLVVLTYSASYEIDVQRPALAFSRERVERVAATRPDAGSPSRTARTPAAKQ
jgi:hypothetical protein